MEDGKPTLRRKIRFLDREEKKKHKRMLSAVVGKAGMWPLTAPGMPPPGPDFLYAAEVLGDTTEYSKATKNKEGVFKPGEKLEELYRRALREPGFTLNVESRKGVRADVTFVPGHIWGQYAAEWGESLGNPKFTSPMVDGPHPAEVMVLGKMPWRHEISHLRNFVSDTGEIVKDLCDKLHIKKADKWYITNLVKFMPPDGQSTLKAGWIHDCLPLLHQELRIVRPKYILCLGADASKWLLGSKFNVSYMAGRVVPYTFRVNYSAEEEPETHTAHVMTVLHPAEVSREPAKARILHSNFSRFSFLITGVNFDLEEKGLDHRVIDTLEDAEDWCEEVDAYFRTKGYKKRDRLIAWDAEWHGQHPINKGSYLRTIQLSWDEKKAVCFKVTHQGGKKAFRDRDGKPAMKRLVKLLNHFMRGKRAVGHFLVSDLEWLNHYGIDPIQSCHAPLEGTDDRQGWERLMHGEGWLDTAYMSHAIEETGMLGLEVLSLRYTTAPRYDIPLEDWKDEYCKEHNIKKQALEGYGDCPDKVLIPYACLHYDSLVQLGDGSWEKIGILVKNRYDGFVKSFRGGKVQLARVTDWHRADVGQKNWFKLRTDTTPCGKHGLIGPVFTPDHKVLTQRGRVPVEQLRIGKDAILTDEVQFSAEQLSVFLGSLLGDGGYTRQNGKRVGFGFGQRIAVAAYADWKAEVFSNFNPAAVDTGPIARRYVLPFSRYLRHLSEKFPAHDRHAHRHRKAVITDELLSQLGDLGLAVWYQDDGCLVKDKRCNSRSSRIYCRKLNEEERDRVVLWLINKVGGGVSYNEKGGFIQITGPSFQPFHELIWRYIHPAMAYKTIFPVIEIPGLPEVSDAPYYEPIREVVRWEAKSRRGYGVRYCLTVEGDHNFLTQAGFVSNCYDADVTLRIAKALTPLLFSDYEGNNCWEPFWESMIVQKVILRIHENGIKVDRARVDDLTKKFLTARYAQEEKVREWAGWPEFNIRSVQQVKEFLFGEKLNGKRDENGKPIRIRPKNARSLYVKPLLDTSKPPRRWDDLVAKGLDRDASPGTGKMILAILAQENLNVSDQINMVRDYRFLDQVLKSVLRHPKTDEDDNWIENDQGELEYEAGLAAAIDDDGKVRTHLYATAETGRWKSSRPNLQNISKSRDPDYIRLLGEDNYKHKLRSVLKASPGYVFVEFDYTGAELAGMAIMAGSKKMQDHCRRALLPDSGYNKHGKKEDGGKYPHPDYYDIHSNVACLAFQLKCLPTKDGLKSIGKSHFRTLAKNVIFGIAYGRGAKAIALSAKEQGVQVTVEEAQMVIDAIFEVYPELQPFFAAASERAINEKWLCHCFGRFRRFPSVSDYKLEDEFARQAMNFPIQGMVASCVDRGIAWLDKAICDQGLEDDIRILLQIHDAVLVECRPHLVSYVKELAKWAMVDQVPIYPTTLDGVPRGDGPYYLGLDFSVDSHWGEKIAKDEYVKLGID